MKVWAILGLLGSAILIAACTPPEQQFQVKQVLDGDSLVLLDGAGNEQTFELALIDAPEKEQPYGREAHKVLTGLVLGKAVRIADSGELFLGKNNINLQLLGLGAGWLNNAALEGATFVDKLAYLDVYREAKNKGLGLWGQPEALQVPPWQWRMQGKRRSPTSLQMQAQRAKAKLEPDKTPR